MQESDFVGINMPLTNFYFGKSTSCDITSPYLKLC